jgi:uncharacterized protein
MILSDANILIYSYNKSAQEHEVCKKWFEEQLSKPDAFAFSWQAITAFMRITTTARLFPQTFTYEQVSVFVESWLSQPNVKILSPTSRHWTIFSRIIRENKIQGPLMMDAHLAALAIEHGATLATTDRDFARFDGLKIVNPLKT